MNTVPSAPYAPSPYAYPSSFFMAPNLTGFPPSRPFEYMKIVFIILFGLTGLSLTFLANNLAYRAKNVNSAGQLSSDATNLFKTADVTMNYFLVISLLVLVILICLSIPNVVDILWLLSTIILVVSASLVKNLAMRGTDGNIDSKAKEYASQVWSVVTVIIVIISMLFGSPFALYAFKKWRQ